MTSQKHLFLGILLFLFSHFSFAQEEKGTCLSGNCNRGYGVMLHTDGKYEGEFFGGKRNGYGTYSFNDGKKMQGMWQNGKLFEGTKGNAAPYQPEFKDKVTTQGTKVARDKNPFVAALYEIIASAEQKFQSIKGDSVDTEWDRFTVWQPTVVLPNAKKSMIRQFNEECKFIFGEDLTEKEAKNLFEDLASKLQSANVNNLWNFQDVSSSPGLPLHKKFYKWTVLTPATIKLEWRKMDDTSEWYMVSISVVK
ncbi:MAG: hypothetical protein ACKVTZ_19600 [Bacteroidia bacterium]